MILAISLIVGGLVAFQIVAVLYMVYLVLTESDSEERK